MTDRRKVLKFALGGAAALAVGGVSVPALAASPDPEAGTAMPPSPVYSPEPLGDCEEEIYKDRNVLICRDAPVLDGIMKGGVFIDGVPLWLMVHHGKVISIVNQHEVHCSLVDAAHDAVDQLQGAALEPRRCRLPTPDELSQPHARRTAAGPLRKSVTALTAQERADFVNALLTLKQDGTYDYFVDMHQRAFSNDWGAHMSSPFLPWHRAYLYLLEYQLQRIKPSITMPYWDWSVQRSAGQPPFTADFMGGDGYFASDAGKIGRPRLGEVTTGPFAYRAGKWPLNVRDDSRPYLRRELGRGVPSLATPEHVSWTLSNSVYDEAPYNDSVSAFRNNVEGWWEGDPGMHNRTHVWVGGSMAPASSPNDPVFFLNHCFVDKLWADWQRKYPSVEHYLPTSGLDTPLEPFQSEAGWTVTPRQLINYEGLYTYDSLI